MDAGSLQERLHLVEIAKQLGLKGVCISDFKAIECQVVDQGTTAIGPTFQEDFCNLITTQKNEAVIFTYLDAFLTNEVYDNTNLTIRDLTSPMQGRWIDNMQTDANQDGLFKAYTVQLPLHMMINRALLHVGLSNRMVGVGITQQHTTNFLQLTGIGYLVSQEIGTQFQKLETNFQGNNVGGLIVSTNGVDAASGRQQSAPGL
jgi:hypothetical protein